MAYEARVGFPIRAVPNLQYIATDLSFSGLRPVSLRNGENMRSFASSQKEAPLGPVLRISLPRLVLQFGVGEHATLAATEIISPCTRLLLEIGV